MMMSASTKLPDLICEVIHSSLVEIQALVLIKRRVARLQKMQTRT
jgi:hypothetical protein